MQRDASLSEFVSETDGTGSEGEKSGAAGTGEAGWAEAAAHGSTAVWDAEGASCAACGACVSRRWRQDDQLVCADCKDWTC